MEIDSEPSKPLPPHTVRIKRKRAQDPLQALVIDANKRTKTDGYVFKLAATYDHDTGGDTLLRAEEGEGSIRRFRVAKALKKDGKLQVPHDDPRVSQSLSEMVQSYLNLQREQNVPEPSSPVKNGPDSDAEVEDYVYDIYYRERIEEGMEITKEVGLVVFDSDDQSHLVIEDSSEDAGDEDSNAEDFYKNDYPDESDGDEIVGSESQSSSEHEAKRMSDFEWSEDENYDDYRDRVLGQLQDQVMEH